MRYAPATVAAIALYGCNAPLDMPMTEQPIVSPANGATFEKLVNFTIPGDASDREGTNQAVGFPPRPRASRGAAR